MDWDWEEGPPRDTPTPRRAADEPEPAAGPEPPEPPDESVTQVFSLETAPETSPDESAPPSHPPEYVLPERTDTGRPAAPGGAEFESPSLRTMEAAERAAVAGAGASRDDARRPRSPEERAARRELRRRQLRRRRLVALAILVAIVVLIVFLIVRGCGGSDAAAAVGLAFVDGRILARAERQ